MTSPWLIASLVALALALAGALALRLLLRSRNMHLWIGAYLKQAGRRRRRPAPHTHVHVAFCDHYEPYWRQADDATARARVDHWLRRYPEVAAVHADSTGRVPQHSFFYPEEEYREDILDDIAGLCRRGYGDVEVHLHHDDDTAENLRATLTRFTTLLHERHGLLRRDPRTGQIVWAFIHGNWALDNSRPDGRWCGVDNELQVLVETGCRVDMTMPSAPSDTQTAKINGIYFARGHEGCRKSHDHGRDARVGDGGAREGELLLVQGPLALNWSSRKAGLVPRIESSEVSADALVTPARVKLWEQAGVSVEGAPQHLFIKLHTHGAEERTARALLDDGGLDGMWSLLEDRFRDREGWSLHYVSAWEMTTRIQALCEGRDPLAEAAR